MGYKKRSSTNLAYRELLSIAMKDLNDCVVWGNVDDILYASNQIHKIAERFDDYTLNYLIYQLENEIHNMSRFELDCWITNAWEYSLKIIDSPFPEKDRQTIAV